jgi:5-amino-6-(5-phospho-D-ribitylamino)uracil phosphatase
MLPPLAPAVPLYSSPRFHTPNREISLNGSTLHRSGPSSTPRQRATNAQRGAGGAIELVAIDIDGTLLRSDKKLTRRSATAIAAACRMGVKVVLASARPPRSVREIYQCLKLDTLQINYNGALIHDPRRRRNIFHLPLSADLAKRVVRHARRAEPDIVISIEILDKWYTDHVDETLPTETSKAFTPDFIGPLDAIVRTPVTKIMLLGLPGALARARKAVLKKFAGQIALAVSDPHLIQIIHPHADKGAALAQVAQKYGVPAERIMAIGDAPNDVGMLEYAGLGVAVANAWDAVRAAADVMVPSNNDDGVAEALRRYVL